jgi:hypothetical protein
MPDIALPPRHPHASFWRSFLLIAFYEERRWSDVIDLLVEDDILLLVLIILSKAALIVLFTVVKRYPLT